MSSKFALPTLFLVLALLASDGLAQIAIPVHHNNRWGEYWSIRERWVDMVVKDQVASVTITDNIVNPCPQNIEVQYVFPLPPDAVVDQFTLVVDGRELTGRMLDAAEARQIYNEIVRRSRDPGLLEYAGYGFYRSSAFPLLPGKTAELIIHYTATCKKDGNLVELWYPLSSGRYCAQPIGHFRINVDLESAGDIVNVYSPSLDLNLNRRSSNQVETSFETNEYRPVSDFQLFYETSSDDIGATFLTYWPDQHQDGYYLMMVSPSPRVGNSTVLPKDIVIVLDHSGSMSGEKIRQARDAVRFVIDNLNSDDRFNFIAYNDRVTTCFSSLLPASRRNIELAIDRLERTDASGGTNIYAALETAMSQFSRWKFFNRRPAYVIFLTDGLPTVGNCNENDILDNTHQANHASARIFTFGVGYDVNVRLLDKLVNQNQGRSAYVKPNESIETKVSSLYKRIKNPVMTGVSATLANFGTREDCPIELGDLFEGDQLIRVGRIYSRNGGNLEDFMNDECAATLTVTGTLRGREQSFEYPIKLDLQGSSSPFRFVEKLWAARRIGQLLEEIQLHGRVQEVVDELIRLSKQYGIVTPYTSFLADEHRDLAAHDQLREETIQKLDVSRRSVSGPQAQMDAVTRNMAKEMAIPLQPSAEGLAMKMGTDVIAEYESSIVEEIATIRIVGNTTLYKKGDVWLTAETVDLDPIHDHGRFTIVKRFTDEYFALVDGNTDEENKVLASQKPDEKLAIRLRGVAYLIE